ncbi:MAG: hypothetical protein JXR26_07265 [Balneolaceae bacterium]|nr:hypothetical protein [Balneolaceae bacterium]
MKFRNVFILNLLIIMMLNPSALLSQDYTQTIKRTLRFSQAGNPSNQLKVFNIHGDVSVEGYDGDKVQITAHRQIDGSNQDIEQARQDLEFVAERDGNTIFVYIDAPFITFEKSGTHDFNYHADNWNNDYEFLHDITVRIPKNSRVDVSTINRGMVSVRNTTQPVSASNVNGKVVLQNIAGATRARTVNGNITARYARSPKEDSEYKTVNGTIEVSYPPDLSADIQFKSLHGELYTDFTNIKQLKTRVDTNKKRAGGSVKYKIDRFSPLRIGNGGPLFNFEVLNGDVYIKRIQS